MKQFLNVVKLYHRNEKLEKKISRARVWRLPLGKG